MHIQIGWRLQVDKQELQHVTCIGYEQTFVDEYWTDDFQFSFEENNQSCQVVYVLPTKPTTNTMGPIV